MGFYIYIVFRIPPIPLYFIGVIHRGTLSGVFVLFSSIGNPSLRKSFPALTEFYFFSCCHTPNSIGSPSGILLSLIIGIKKTGRELIPTCSKIIKIVLILYRYLSTGHSFVHHYVYHVYTTAQCRSIKSRERIAARFPLHYQLTGKIIHINQSNFVGILFQPKQSIK